MGRELKGSGGGNWYSWKTAAVGTELIGRFKGLGHGIYEGKETSHGKFVFADGTEKNVNAPVILADKLSDAQIGDILLIRFTGVKPSKGGRNGAKDFYVEVLDNFPSVPAVPPQTQTSAGPSEAELAAARALLGIGTAAPANPWDALVARLRTANPKGADALLSAVKDMSQQEKIDALDGYLKQVGG